jgi:hypothetical protein
VVNIVFLGVMNYALWAHLTKPGLHLTEGITGGERRYFSFRAIVTPATFVIVGILYLLVSPKYAVWILITIPFTMWIFRRVYLKKPQLAGVEEKQSKRSRS